MTLLKDNPVLQDDIVLQDDLILLAAIILKDNSILRSNASFLQFTSIRLQNNEGRGPLTWYQRWQIPGRRCILPNWCSLSNWCGLVYRSVFPNSSCLPN